MFILFIFPLFLIKKCTHCTFFCYWYP